MARPAATEGTRLLGGATEEGSEDRQELPRWRRPSVFWLIGPYAIYTLAFGGVVVPKLNLIVDLVCKQYFADQQLLHPSTPFPPVVPGADNRQCTAPGVQTRVAALMLVLNLVTGLLSAVVTPRLGRLSDRHGRKRLMALTSCGGLLSELVTIAAVRFPARIHYRWLTLGATLDGLAGSLAAGSMLSQSYASDCTRPSRRAVSFGYIHACLFTGLALGPLLAGHLGRWTGSLVSILYVCFGCHAVFIVFAAFIMPESLSKKRRRMAQEAWEREKRSSRDSGRGSWSSVVRAANPLLPVRILWPRGPGTSPRLRANLVVLAAANTIIMGIPMAAAGVILLYSQLMFGWGNYETATYVSTVSFVRAFVLLCVFPAVNYWGRSRHLRHTAREDKATGADRLDIWVFRVALASDLLGGAGWIVARTPPAFVAAGVVTALGGLGSATAQSVVTKHVAPERVGQVLGAIGTMEALARVVGPIMFNGLYALTVGAFPQAIFVLLFGLYALSFVCSFILKPGVYWKDGQDDEPILRADAGRILAAEEQGFLP